MNAIGNPLFSGSAFSQYQYRGIRRGDLYNLVKYIQQEMASAYNALKTGRKRGIDGRLERSTLQLSSCKHAFKRLCKGSLQATEKCHMLSIVGIRTTTIKRKVIGFPAR